MKIETRLVASLTPTLGETLATERARNLAGCTDELLSMGCEDARDAVVEMLRRCTLAAVRLRVVPPPLTTERLRSAASDVLRIMLDETRSRSLFGRAS